jgi:outer membrane protein insertion porin family
MYEILLRIEGTLDRFEYQLSSNPHLSQQDIIAVLATGKTLRELGGGTSDEGAAFTGDMAANYFAGALTGAFEKQLEKLLGLERLQINPVLGDASADATTRVTLGKEISDDVMVVVSQEFGANPRQLYQVEWQATRKHMVTLQTDNRAGTGGTLSYFTRYWWKKENALAAGAVGGSGEVDAAPAALVRRIRIEGVEEDRAEALEKKLPLKEGDPIRPSKVFSGSEAIRRHYIREGRILAKVQTDVEDAPGEPLGVIVVYHVDPGPAVDVQLEGVSKKEARKLRSRLEKLWSESLFVEGMYEDSAQLIGDHFRQRGFYAVDVEYHEEGDGEQIRFTVDRGSVVRVTRVEIRGAEGVPEERIRRQMLTRTSSIFSRGRLDPDVLEEDLRAIRNLYFDQGYIGVQIAEPRIRLSALAETAEILIEIDEGPRFTVESVEFPPDLGFAEADLRSWAGLAAGDLYSPAALLRAESGLRAGIDRQGYPQASVRASVEVGEDRVRVGFRVDRGEKMRVGEIVISGNRQTLDRVMRREMELAPGDLLSRERLLRAQHRLYRLGVFSSVNVAHEAMDDGDPGLQRVRVEVREAKPLGMSVGIGYDTERGPQGSFSTSHDNLFGHVRTLGIQLFLSDTLRRAQIVAREPRLFGYKLPALVDYSTEHRVEAGYTLDRDSVAFRVDRRLSPTWKGYLRYNFQKQDLSDVSDPTAPEDEKLENLKLGDVGVALVQDLRDDPLMTTRGTYFLVGGNWFSKVLFSDSNFIKGNAFGNATLTFGNRATFATSVRISLGSPYGETAEIPISERFFAGGQSTIRGFGLDEVGPKNPETGRPLGGEARLILNQEFRFPLWGRFRGVLFYDAGNVYRKLSDLDPFDLRHVLGIGARFNAPFGPVRAEYGWKMDRERGESAGEFHFAIGAVF